MKIISAREFRQNQGKYFDMATSGNDVIVKTRNRGSFKITPITKDDSLMSKEEFFKMIDRARNSKSYILTEEEEQKLFNSLI